MKLIMENWRGYVNEVNRAGRAKEISKQIAKDNPHAISMFYEWLVNEKKDQVFINWIKIHKERVKYMALRQAGKEEVKDDWGPMVPVETRTVLKHVSFEIDDPNYTHCESPDGRVPWQQSPWEVNLVDISGNPLLRRDRGTRRALDHRYLGRTGQAQDVQRRDEFVRAFKSTLKHVDKIKMKFPYDVFPDDEEDSNIEEVKWPWSWKKETTPVRAAEKSSCRTELCCKKKLIYLDATMWATIRCPYTRPSSGDLTTENMREARQPGELTTYEKCARDLRDLKKSETEMDPYELSTDADEEQDETPT